MLVILLGFRKDTGRSACPAPMEKMECSLPHFPVVHPARFFLLLHAALPPNGQTWNILAGELSRMFPGFLKSEWLFLFVLHHNLKVLRTMPFPVLQLYPMQLLFLQMACW